MNPNDLLATLAEISVAFVGFASIVAVIHSVRSDSWLPGDRILFRALIETGLGSVVLSLVPIAVSIVGMSTPTIWVVSSSIFAITVVVAVIRRFYQYRRYAGELPKFGRTFVIPVAFLGLVINVANIFVWQTAAAYVIGVLLLVVTASGMFLNLIIRFFPLSNDEDA